jgi:hypothetical protein
MKQKTDPAAAETARTTDSPAVVHERLVLPLWAEWGDGPEKRGDYRIKIESKDGKHRREITAWYNPGSGHWLICGNECGFHDLIQAPGTNDEWRITHWQNSVVRSISGSDIRRSYLRMVNRKSLI